MQSLVSVSSVGSLPSVFDLCGIVYLLELHRADAKMCYAVMEVIIKSATNFSGNGSSILEAADWRRRADRVELCNRRAMIRCLCALARYKSGSGGLKCKGEECQIHDMTVYVMLGSVVGKKK